MVQFLTEERDAMIVVEFDGMQAQRIRKMADDFMPFSAPGIQVTGKNDRAAMIAQRARRLLELMAERLEPRGKIHRVHIHDDECLLG